MPDKIDEANAQDELACSELGPELANHPRMRRIRAQQYEQVAGGPGFDHVKAKEQPPDSAGTDNGGASRE